MQLHGLVSNINESKWKSKSLNSLPPEAYEIDYPESYKIHEVFEDKPVKTSFFSRFLKKKSSKGDH